MGILEEYIRDTVYFMYTLVHNNAIIKHITEYFSCSLGMLVYTTFHSSFLTEN